MSKAYHFSPDLNEPRPCSNPANCKFGSDTKHYDSPEQYYAEEAANAGTGITNTIKVDADEEEKRAAARAESMVVSGFFDAGEFGDSYTTDRRNGMLHIQKSTDHPAEESVMLGDDGEPELESSGWTVMTGFSNADKSTGLMHPSEQIDGGPAEYMAQNPGTYQAVVVDAEDEDGDIDAVGWALLRKDEDVASESVGDGGNVHIRAEGRSYIVEAFGRDGEPAGSEPFEDLEQAKEQYEAYRVQLEDE